MADAEQQAGVCDGPWDAASVDVEPDGATLLRLLSAVQALASGQQRVEDKLTRLAAGLSVDLTELPTDGAQGPTFSRHTNSSRTMAALQGNMHRHANVNYYNRPSGTCSSRGQRCIKAPSVFSSRQLDASDGGNDPNGSLAAWPSTITLRKGLEDDQEDFSMERLDVLLSQRRSSQSYGIVSRVVRRNSSLFLSEDSNGWRLRSCKRLALSPNSHFMTLHDILGFIILMHDLLMTPVILSWNFVVEGVLLQAAWCAGTYWAIDLVLNFLIGFYRRGELIMTQPDVCRHYLKTSFLLDLLLLMGDLMSLLEDVGSAPEGADLLRVGKVTRLLKVFRVARLVKLMERVSSSTTSRILYVLYQVLKVVCGMLLTSHVICCLWYYLGRAGHSLTGLSWLDTPLLGEGAIRDADPLQQYLASFQWTIAQITLGSSNVVPVTWLERFFSILLLIIGLLFSSIIVAFLSAQVVQFIMLRQDRTQQLDDLRKFLRQASVPAALAARVMTQTSERLREEQLLCEEDVAAMGLLSNTLRSELLVAMRLPHVLTHPLFQTWRELDMGAVRSLCEWAVSFTIVPKTDVVFVPGMPAEHAQYVVGGELRYTQVPESSVVEQDTVSEVKQGSWLCEAALWSAWVHVGMLEARATCQLLSVSAAGLLQVLQAHGTPASMTKSYARSFHARLATAMPPWAEWPTDLCVPFANPSELLSRSAGIALLSNARRSGTVELHSEQSSQLTEELRQGLCMLQQSKDGSGLERIVTLVNLRLEHDGQIFTQVGKWDAEHGVVPRCQLPGRKKAACELPHAAIRMMLRKQLAPLEPYLVLGDVHRAVKHEDSIQYGLPTSYVEMTYQASLTVPRDQFAVPVLGMTVGTLDCTGLNEVFQRGVYMLPTENSHGLFCWLSPAERGLLESPANAASWRQWLAQLHITSPRIRTASL